MADPKVWSFATIIQFFHRCKTGIGIRFGNVKVHHGGADVGMSHLFFYAHNIKPHLEQVGGVAMAQGMYTGIFINPRLF